MSTITSSRRTAPPASAGAVLDLARLIVEGRGGYCFVGEGSEHRENKQCVPLRVAKQALRRASHSSHSEGAVDIRYGARKPAAGPRDSRLPSLGGICRGEILPEGPRRKKEVQRCPAVADHHHRQDGVAQRILTEARVEVVARRADD